MNLHCRHAIVIFGALLQLILLCSGCAQVVETVPFDSVAAGAAPPCRSTLGAYYLPRALIRFTATKSNGTITASLNPALNVVADRTQALCLDYLSLPTSRDIITVQRDTDTGLLKSISSDVTDRTPQIINALTATGANLTIAAARAATTPNETIDLEFDPFVQQELLAAKEAMRPYGFCLYVERHSFPSSRLDAAGILAAGRRWCSTERPPEYADPAESFAALPVSSEAIRSGVLYRPNMVQNIVILQKTDPSGPGAWQLYQLKRFEMPNASPVLSVQVRRAMFTERKTTLMFDHGVLTDVAIDKQAELAGFVSIPLALAQAIVSVPAQIVTFRLTDINNQAALLGAQTQLIQSVQTYNQTVAANPLPAGTPRSADVRSAQIYGACKNAGGDIEDCKGFARSGSQ